ncbi:hypothetical protein V8D89_003646 [Ganoderma adspersum]
MTVSLVPTKAGELPAGFSSLGYPSFGPALASLAVQEFSEVHEWAFRSLAKAYVLSNGGIEWSQNPPKRLFLLLAPTATAGTRERNPTRTFRLSSYAFTPFDETLAADPVMVDDPARQEGLRKVAVDMWGWHPAYVGLLPIYPAISTGRLGDIVLLSGGSINAGIPLRTVDSDSDESGPEGMMLALPGQFVRGQNGSWSWSALFSRWGDCRRGVHQHLDELFDTLTLGDAPGDNIAAFNFL